VQNKITSVQRDDQLAQDEKDSIVRDLTEKFVNEEDWRGFFLPKDLTNSVLFTRSQLLQLIDRKRELDIEIQKLKDE
jgi:hypothetical protein